MSSSNRRVLRLEEVCLKITDGAHFSPKENIIGFPMLSVKDMTDYGFDYSSSKRISEDDYKTMLQNDCVPKKNDILVAKDGSYLKHIFVTKQEKEEAILSSIAIFRPNTKMITPNYLSYTLKNPVMKRIIKENYVSGSALPRIVLKDFKKIKIEIPPLPEQKAIAATLSCLDDVIELNNRTNQVLEEMAQAIFKHWFVDFEFPNEDGQPYKFSGGTMVDSELGEIPEGWRVKKLGKIVSVTSGKRPNTKTDSKTNEFWVPLVGASSIMGYVNDYLYDEPILVIGRVGTHGIIQRFSGPSWPSDNTLVFKSKYYEFTYQILKNIDYKVFNRGSTQPLITQTDMKNFGIILPPNDVIAVFENIIGGLFILLHNNKIENDKLGYLRDTLLPKLMSGEIRVPVEEVV